MAKFKVDDVFKIIHRGYILSGDIVDGEIAENDLIDLTFNNGSIKFKIDSIEHINKKGKPKVGILIKSIDDLVQENIDNMLGKTLSITKIPTD